MSELKIAVDKLRRSISALRLELPESVADHVKENADAVLALIPSESTPGAPWNDIAASAYRAYAASTGHKNFRGEEMPSFGELPLKIRTAWQAAVRQAVEVSNGGSYGLDVEQRWNGWEMP